MGLLSGFGATVVSVYARQKRGTAAILPKTYLTRANPRCRQLAVAAGLPEKLVSIGASDLKAETCEDTAFQLGIELDYPIPRVVLPIQGLHRFEPFFDGLNDTLSSSLPGRRFATGPIPRAT